MTKQCKHPGCSRPEYRIGYCTTHRNRFRLGKDMDAPFRSEVAVQDRFWAKVDKSGKCWTWKASKSPEGYGNFWINEKWSRAHRVSFEWAHGPIPDGHQVDHICLNESCVNPDHLRLATNALNGQNRAGAYSNNKTGSRGVSWSERDGKWRAYATVNYKRYWIGYFPTRDEAERAVTEWRREHMPYSIMDQERKEAA